MGRSILSDHRPECRLINITIDSRVLLCPGAPYGEFSIVDLLSDLKTVLQAAVREPVAITQHGKRRIVLMMIEHF
jgi:hypothetical protein